VDRDAYRIRRVEAGTFVRRCNWKKFHKSCYSLPEIGTNIYYPQVGLRGEMTSAYRNCKVLVTGGLGFIGSNLALHLAADGAEVTVVDSSVEGCGANPRNLFGAASQIRVIPMNIGDAADFACAIRSSDVIFNLAGEVSHLQSMKDPKRDMDLNASSQLRFLEECARQRPGVRVVYASTRQIYGAPRHLPVDESHPIQPLDFNGIHKYAATAYHQVLTSAGALDAVVLCLTNVYGPRMALDVPAQGFLGGFLRKAMLREPIVVFGDGRQSRDPVYVDDVVSAFMLAGAATNPPNRMWNVGGSQILPLSTIAGAVSAAAGSPAPVFRPFPPELKRIDIGSYYSDSTRIRNDLGWSATVDFSRGIRHTIRYYRDELGHYLHAANCRSDAARAGWAAAEPQPVAI
jgi:UDP-glucose 4-epimerase